MRRPIVIFAIIFAAAIIAGITIKSNSTRTLRDDFSLKNSQDAYSPPHLTKSGYDPSLNLLDIWQQSSTPIIQRMDEPMGSENGFYCYNAQPFWEMNTSRGGNHTGDDLNGIGGMNTDLGDPVFAAADGLVVYTGEPSNGWGKTIILNHKLPDGKTIQTMYAHLHTIDIAINNYIGRGEKIGTVGTGNGNYPAHLHYEVRISEGIDIGRGYHSNKLNRVKPSDIRTPIAAKPDDLSPSIATVLNANKFEQLIIEKGADKLIDILGKGE